MLFLWNLGCFRALLWLSQDLLQLLSWLDLFWLLVSQNVMFRLSKYLDYLSSRKQSYLRSVRPIGLLLQVIEPLG